MKKNYALTLNIMLAASFSLSARTVEEIVQIAKSRGINIREAIGRTRIFRRANSGITSLEGLNTVPNSESAWVLDLSGNDLGVIKKNSFKNYPNLKYLDLSNCNIKEVEPGAFDGLSNLYVLRLEDNQLRGFDRGDFKGTKPAVLTINNNPNTKKLKKQAQRHLPKTTVMTGTLTLEMWRNILAAAGLLALLGGGLLYFAAPKKAKPGISAEIPPGWVVPVELDPLVTMPSEEPVTPSSPEEVIAATELAYKKSALLMKAIEGDNLEKVRQLIEDGADIMIPAQKGDPYTTLMAAIKEDNQDMINLILEEAKKRPQREWEFFLNAKDAHAATALIWATISQNEPTVKQLIELEVDLNAQDNFGLTALKHATDSEQTNLVEMLEAAGATSSLPTLGQVRAFQQATRIKAKL